MNRTILSRPSCTRKSQSNKSYPLVAATRTLEQQSLPGEEVLDAEESHEENLGGNQDRPASDLEAKQKEGNNMTTHAIKTTQNEIDNGYREPEARLAHQGGQGALAVKHSFYLAKTDATSPMELYQSLRKPRAQPSTHQRANSERPVEQLAWCILSDVFIAHAVLTVANATKNRSESVLKCAFLQWACAGGHVWCKAAPI